MTPHLSIIQVCWQTDGEEYAMSKTSQNVLRRGVNQHFSCVYGWISEMTVSHHHFMWIWVD